MFDWIGFAILAIVAIWAVLYVVRA